MPAEPAAAGSKLAAQVLSQAAARRHSSGDSHVRAPLSYSVDLAASAGASAGATRRAVGFSQAAAALQLEQGGRVQPPGSTGAADEEEQAGAQGQQRGGSRLPVPGQHRAGSSRASSCSGQEGEEDEGDGGDPWSRLQSQYKLQGGGGGRGGGRAAAGQPQRARHRQPSGEAAAQPQVEELVLEEDGEGVRVVQVGLVPLGAQGQQQRGWLLRLLRPVACRRQGGAAAPALGGAWGRSAPTWPSHAPRNPCRPSQRPKPQ